MITALATFATLCAIFTVIVTASVDWEDRLAAWAVFLWFASATVALYATALWIEHGYQP